MVTAQVREADYKVPIYVSIEEKGVHHQLMANQVLGINFVEYRNDASPRGRESRCQQPSISILFLYDTLMDLFTFFD